MIQFKRISHIPVGVTVALAILFLVAVFAPAISNNKPIIVLDESGLSFPIFSGEPSQVEQRGENAAFILHPPIPYLPSDIDLDHAGKPPLTFPQKKPWYHAHWLGTDEIGRDVLAHLIYGCRSSVMIAVGAMAIALLIGLSLGALGGYWHEQRLGLTLPVVLLIAVTAPILFNGMKVAAYHLSTPVTAIVVMISVSAFGIVVGLCNRWMNRLLRGAIRGKTNRINLFIHPDRWVIGLTNFFTTIPAYFALLAFLAIWSTPNAASISLALGLLMWPDITRLTRSTIIQLRKTGMAESAESLGYSPIRVVLYHLLPNALQPAMVALGFGIGGAIMAESFLSFVGVAPAEMVSWGTLLAKTRSYPDMWWLSVFPGVAIFCAVLVFYRLSSSLEKPLGQTA